MTVQTTDMPSSTSNDTATSTLTSTLQASDIEAVARLSRLAIDPATAADYAKDIGKILIMMDTLAQVDTDGIVPLTNVHDATQPLRPDVADSAINRDANQRIAPNVQDGLYLVPQVIE